MIGSSTLVDTLNDAIQNNNNGALMIETGCYREARVSLQIAVRQTRGVAHAMRRDRLIPKSSSSVQCRWTQVAPLHLSDTDPFLFRRALAIMPKEAKPDLSNCTAESTTMLYNLGLSFHLEAESRHRERVKYHQLLERALECYRVVVSLRGQHQQNKQLHNISGEQLFDLSLAINVAEVLRYFMNYTEAAVFYDQVSENLHTFQNILATEDITGVCLNLASFIVPQLAPAA